MRDIAQLEIEPEQNNRETEGKNAGHDIDIDKMTDCGHQIGCGRDPVEAEYVGGKDEQENDSWVHFKNPIYEQTRKRKRPVERKEDQTQESQLDT